MASENNDELSGRFSRKDASPSVIPVRGSREVFGVNWSAWSSDNMSKFGVAWKQFDEIMSDGYINEPVFVG